MRRQRQADLTGQKGAEARQPTLVDVHVGWRLRDRRVMAGLTQEQLATRLCVTFQQVKKYENGTNRLSASRLYQCSRVLGVSILWFFEGLAGMESTVGDQAEHSTAALRPRSLEDPEVRLFVRTVHRIADPEKRRRLRALAAVLADNDDSPE
jgi:transcriptional regulator with XRE-family HTH domain